MAQEWALGTCLGGLGDMPGKSNYSKCYVMHFSWSTGYFFPPEFSIGDSHILEEKKTISIIGIQVQANLRWDAKSPK